jgi:hypothetical protein
VAAQVAVGRATAVQVGILVVLQVLEVMAAVVAHKLQAEQ